MAVLVESKTGAGRPCCARFREYRSFFNHIDSFLFRPFRLSEEGRGGLVSARGKMEVADHALNVQNDYANEVQKTLWDAGLYADVDISGETFKKKIRNGEVAQYNFILGVSLLCRLPSFDY